MNFTISYICRATQVTQKGAIQRRVQVIVRLADRECAIKRTNELAAKHDNASLTRGEREMYAVRFGTYIAA